MHDEKGEKHGLHGEDHRPPGPEKDLKDQAAKLVEEDKLDDATALADQMEAINKQIAGLEALAKASREGAPTPSMTACCTTARASPGTAGRTPQALRYPGGAAEGHL